MPLHTKASAERAVKASSLPEDDKANYLQQLQSGADPTQIVNELKSRKALFYGTKIQKKIES